jgi:hypothetical protein
MAGMADSAMNAPAETGVPEFHGADIGDDTLRGHLHTE